MQSFLLLLRNYLRSCFAMLVNLLLSDVRNRRQPLRMNVPEQIANVIGN
jgi:hypothetical protein